MPGSNRLPVWLSHCIDAWKSPLYIFARIHMNIIYISLNVVHTILSMIPFTQIIVSRHFHKCIKQYHLIERIKPHLNLWHCMTSLTLSWYLSNFHQHASCCRKICVIYKMQHIFIYRYKYCGCCDVMKKFYQNVCKHRKQIEVLFHHHAGL